MKVKRESEVAQLYPTLSDPMACSLPGSSVHGIFQARVLEWGAIAFSGKSTSLPELSHNLSPLLPFPESIPFLLVNKWQPLDLLARARKGTDI